MLEDGVGENPDKIRGKYVPYHHRIGSVILGFDDKADLSTGEKKLNEIYDGFISEMVPSLPRYGEVITTFAGNRAAATTEDFIIGFARTVKDFINIPDNLSKLQAARLNVGPLRLKTKSFCKNLLFTKAGREL